MVIKHLFLLFIGNLGEIKGWRQYCIFMCNTGFFFQVRSKSSIQNNNFPMF